MWSVAALLRGRPAAAPTKQGAEIPCQRATLRVFVPAAIADA